MNPYDRSLSVYSNEIEPIATFYAPGANQRMADDLELAAGACDVVYYNLAVVGDGRVGPTFDVHTELWNGDPCDAGSAMILGTGADFADVPNDAAMWLLEAFLDTSTVAIPETVWLAATFSLDGAGWIIAETAEVGVTGDFWSEDDTALGCAQLWFGGNPYAGFWANVNCQVGGDPVGACCNGTTCTEVTEAECAGGTWQGAFTTCDLNPCQPGACCAGEDFTTCTDTTEAGCFGSAELFHPDAACIEEPCLPGFKVYENDFLTGLFNTLDTSTVWGDDLVFGPGLPCDLLAYDITMVGARGSPDFDVHVELWTNDDRGTPSDEEDDIPLAQITGTIGDFTGVPADQLAHTLLAGPFDGIPLPEMVWMVFSTSSDQAGPLLAGMANTGFSRDAFAIFNAPGNPGVWRENFSFGGFNPTGCPGGGECNPAGSFQINVWCAGEEPTGACGNGSIDPGEECDGGFGCTDCLCDANFEPTVPPSLDCQATCGNGVVDPGEECDGGLGCTDCLCDADFEPTAPPSLDCQAICGNGSVDPGEECDGGLGCTACLCDADFEPTAPPSLDCQPICGNGSVDPGEQCDGTDDTACPGACLSDCTCGPFCGNGVCDPGEDSCNCPDDCGTPPLSEVPGATCADGNDNDCDGLTDSADPDCVAIPTVSAWGLIIMALLLLTGIKVKFGGRRPKRA
jgi:hypothetical protein